MLPSIKNKTKGRTTFFSVSDSKIATHDGSIIIIWTSIKVDLVAYSILRDRLFVWFLEDTVGDILAKLGPVGWRVKRVGSDQKGGY